MQNKDHIAGFISFISSLILIMVILLIAIEINAFNLDFYSSEYDKLGQTEEIGISEQDLMHATESLLAYIKGERDNLNVDAVINGELRPVFNQRETEHMVDVRGLYGAAFKSGIIGIGLLSALLLIMLWMKGKGFVFCWAKGYLAAAAVCLGLLLILMWAANTKFTEFWNCFHKVFFADDLWILNPETDILIQMVPEQFFYDLVVKIFSSFAIAAAFPAAAAAIIIRKDKRTAGTDQVLNVSQR